jgi:hypothetical protein
MDKIAFLYLLFVTMGVIMWRYKIENNRMLARPAKRVNAGV